MPIKHNTLLAIRMTSAINRLIYYTRKLPLVGSKIPDSVYYMPVWKRVFAILALIASVIWGVGNKFLYVGFMVWIPVTDMAGEAWTDAERLAVFMHIFLLLSFVAAGVSYAIMLEPKREKFVAVKLMRMLPDDYMRTTLLYRYLTYFLFYIPALVFFLPRLKAPVWLALSLAAVLTLWRVFCEYGHLLLFRRTGKALIRDNVTVWVTIGICYAWAYTPLFLEGVPLLGGILLQWPALVLLAAAGLYAWVRLARYDGYRAVVDAASRRDDPLLDFQQMMSEAQKTSVAVKEQDYEATALPSGKLSGREGYDYLNALFFARHRRLIIKPVLRRLLAIGAVGLAGVAAVFLFDEERVHSVTSQLPASLRFLPFVMNFLAIGEMTCRALFYHCDLSLLRYPFYRKGTFRHFCIRLYRMTGLNLLVGGALSLAVTIAAIAAGGVSATDLVLLWACALALSVFFSVHHLFMYYIFQPFATDLNTKNPYYWIVNMVVSALCGVLLVLPVPPAAFTCVVLALALVYTAAALWLVFRFGSRTFRVR